MRVGSRTLALASRWFPVAAAIAAGVICLALGRYRFPYFAFDPDTAAYFFQAKLFAGGMLAAEAPPDFGFSSSPHINIHNGLWYAKYPFGNSLFLAPGVLLGLPWIMPAIATSLTLLLFFAIVRELFDNRVAALALLLGLLSPTTLIIGSTLLSQPTSRLWMALFLWALLRALREDDLLRRLLLSAISGLALGYGFNTRPLVAVVFGAVGLGLFLHRVIRSPGKIRLLASAGAVVLAALPLLGLFFAWNAYLTGDPWLLPYHALQAADRMGFGVRGEGYAPFVSDFRIDFTPAIALARIWQHTIPCVLFNIVGWGQYWPNMFLFDDPQRHFPLMAWVLLVPAILVVLPFLHRSRSAGDVTCASIFLLTLAVLFFQYSDHSTWGWTPLHCSYYNEATLLGLVPLLARGMLIVYDTARRTSRDLIYNGVIAVYLVLLANTLYTNAGFIKLFGFWDPYYQHLPRLVAEADLHRAVVFVPNSRNAPVGEYPFVPLERADVVYFRTGPLPQWGLNAGDWRAVYERYFAGRTAHLFDTTGLRQLERPPRLKQSEHLRRSPH